MAGSLLPLFWNNLTQIAFSLNVYKEILMLDWAITIAILVSLIAFLSVGGIAGFALQAAKLVVTLAIIIFIISAVVGLVRRKPMVS